MFTCIVSEHHGKPCVAISNNAISIKIATSGGAIVSVTTPKTEINPLWEPPWKTVPVGLRHLAAKNGCFSQKNDDILESQLLSTIGGHSLCCDVFGAHSKGEVEKAGLSFHGEAGLTEWQVTSVTTTSVTMSCRLVETQLILTREYTPSIDGTPVVKVTETMQNLCGFLRALGKTQHVTIGSEMLNLNTENTTSIKTSCTFTCNCDRGTTWPTDNGVNSFFAVGQDFQYPNIPRKNNVNDGLDDWRTFPRCKCNSDLCTMRVNPNDDYGWFVVEKKRTVINSNTTSNTIEPTSSVMFSYIWERKDNPWLMTWEENHSRSQEPWNGRTLCRGLEFGSCKFSRGIHS